MAHSYRGSDPRSPRQEGQRCPSILEGVYPNYPHRAMTHPNRFTDHTQNQRCLLIDGAGYPDYLLQVLPRWCELIDPRKEYQNHSLYRPGPLRVRPREGHLPGHHIDTHFAPRADHLLLHYLIPLYQVYIPQALRISSYIPIGTPTSCHNLQIPPHKGTIAGCPHGPWRRPKALGMMSPHHPLSPEACPRLLIPAKHNLP